VRQLSAPGRTAVWIAASMAVLATAGCMSVSDEGGAKPAPSSSAERRGTGAEPDGGHVLPGGPGRQAGGGGDSSRDVDGKGESASPASSGSASAGARPSEAAPPPSEPKPSAPPGDAGPSASAPQSSMPPPQESPEPPVESPPPSPPQPSDPPSASSAPEVHAGAMRVVPADGDAEPSASPQSRPDGAGRSDGAGRPAA
jgi:hypothetical protein